MALKETIENQGIFLFKYRGHIPILFVLLAVPVAFFSPNYGKIGNLILFFSAMLFIVCGHLVRARTVGRRNFQSSGRNRSHQVAADLNTTGWYSMVRHPLYFANFLIWIGLVIFLGNPWFVVILGLLFWLYYERIMFAEEQFLERKFSSKYIAWAERIPAFLPSIKHYEASDKEFSWRIVFKNEYPGLLSSMTSLLFIMILKRTAKKHTISFSMNDLYFAVFILIFGLTFKLLKSKTSVFYEND